MTLGNTDLSRGDLVALLADDETVSFWIAEVGSAAWIVFNFLTCFI